MEAIKKFTIMNEILKRYYILNSLASNAPISTKGEMKKRTLNTMKFNSALDVCQNTLFKFME